MPFHDLNCEAVKFRKKGKQKKKRNALVSCLLPPEIPEDRIELSDEDFGDITRHRQYAGFISNLDTSTITKQVLKRKPNEKEGRNLELYYEKKAKHMLPSRDEDGQAEFIESADLLPIKTLSGKLQYCTSYIGKTEGPEKIFPSPKKKNAHVQKSKPAAVSQEIELSAEQAPGVAYKMTMDAEGRKGRHKQSQKRAKTDSTKYAHGGGILTSVSQVLQTSAVEELKKDISEEEKVAELRAHIAELATAVLADPEANIEMLKELQDLCSNQIGNMARLAMLSLLAVFQDVVPGYRIRLPTQKELDMQVSKEVRNLRQYETKLLHSYQKYLQTLTSFIKSGAHLKSALRCVCGLLHAIPHFNYRESLLSVIVSQMDSSDSVCREMCCDAVKALFQNEGKHGGDGTVEAVQMITDLVKMNDCILQPDVVQVFLALSFDDDLNIPASEHEVTTMNQNAENFKSKHQAKKENKAKKHLLAAELREEVLADLKESSSVPDNSKRRSLQTQTLSAVFETYFRILKASLKSNYSDPKPRKLQSKVSNYGPRPLLRPCLDGLGKFSHLISVDFMGDLLGVLKRLAAGFGTKRTDCREDENPLTSKERLQCCVVAFRIVKSNLDALTVDLHDFYISFYNILLSCDYPRDGHSGEVLAEALHVMFWENRQQDMQRVAAFLKCLSAMSVQAEPAEAMAALVTSQHLLQHHKRCRNLLENDGDGAASGCYSAVLQGNVMDHDLNSASSSVLWEITLLSRHYHPGIANLASQISTMVDSTEEIFLATASPKQAALTYSTSKGGFYPSVQPPKRTVRKNSYVNKHDALNVTFLQNYGNLDVEASDELDRIFSSHFKYLKNIKENEMLKKNLQQDMRSSDLVSKDLMTSKVQTQDK